jgi:kynurenine formamidase
MSGMADFDRVAADVRNWGRWGDADELGTLNLITDEKVREAASLVRAGKVFPLGIAFGADGPMGMFKFRTNPIHLMTIDGGDASSFAEYARKWTGNPTAQTLAGIFDASRFRFNDDYIMMPLQSGTQWDALSHAYYDGQLYNGFSSDSVTSQGAVHCGIDKVDVKGIVSRGVLLDVVRHRGAGTALDHGQQITPQELDDVVRSQGVTIGTGDIVLIRTGWWNKFLETGNPAEMTAGMNWECAAWLHDLEVAAVASDNIAVEDLESGVEGMFLPLHCLCLRDMGLMLGEYWDMTALAADCAADGVYEFQLVAPPLRVTGGVGSPLNPIAMK